MFGSGGFVSGGIGEDTAFQNDPIPFRLERQDATNLVAIQQAPHYVTPNGTQFDSVTANLQPTAELVDYEGAIIPVTVPTAGVLYYVYFMGAGILLGQLRASDVEPTVINGHYVLGAATGVSESSVLIGAFVLDAAGEFVDTETFRGVLSYYYRRQKSIFTCPGYVDNNANTDLAALNSATWTAINGGVGDYVFAISWIDGAPNVAASFTLGAAATAVANCGVADSNPPGIDIVAACSFGLGALAGTTSACSGAAPLRVGQGLAQAKTFTLKAMTTAANLTLRADNARNGAGADPAMTYLTGSLWG